MRREYKIEHMDAEAPTPVLCKELYGSGGKTVNGLPAGGNNNAKGPYKTD